MSSFQEDSSKYKLPRLTLLKDAGKKSRSTANVSAANDAGLTTTEIDRFAFSDTLVATGIDRGRTRSCRSGVRVNKIATR